MYHLYCYVPPCKKCGSYKTGHFVIDNISPQLYKKSLAKGEYVIPVPYMDRYESLNCFCLDCGISWHEDLKIKLFSSKMIKEQKKLRGITSKNINSNINRYFSTHRRLTPDSSFKKRIAKFFK